MRVYQPFTRLLSTVLGEEEGEGERGRGERVGGKGRERGSS